MRAATARRLSDRSRADEERPRSARVVFVFRAVLYFALISAFLWGGDVIRAAAVCALALAILADWDGGTRHLLRLVGLSLLICLAPALGFAIGDHLAGGLAVAPMVAAGAAMVCIALALFLAYLLASRHLTAAIRCRRRLDAVDHVFGALLGTAEGAAVVVVGCWMLATLQAPIWSLRSRLPDDLPSTQRWMVAAVTNADTAVRADPVGQWLASANPLERVPAIQTVQLAAELAVEPQRLLAAAEDGRLDHIAELPEVRPYVDALANDLALRYALQRGDFHSLLNSPQVREMLQDRELHRALLAHCEEIRAAIGLPDYASARR